MSKMKEGWEYKKFEDALEKVKYTKKLQTNEFLSEGRVPIISQEEDYISGFWNNPEDAFKVEKPIVIFGDHSRVIKYVDFDFVLGADGVKILKPIESLNAKFLYHYLKWYNVPSMGYSRHFKFLKEINMPIPPINEQQQIVSELDLLSGVIEKQKAQLEELEKLAQSIFYDMFGDPVNNEKGWEMKKLYEISNVGTGSTPSRNNGKYYEGGAIPWVKTTEVQNCEIFETEEKISELAIKETNCKVYPIGTLLLAMYGQGKTRGQLAKLRIEAATNQACAAIVLNNDFSIPDYVYEYLHLQYENIRDMARGGNQLNLNLNIVKAIPIFLPPLSLQQEFAAKVEAIEAMKAKVRQSLKEAETLFNSRMDYYFN